MSAYVVENVTINRILTFLNRQDVDSELRRPIEELGYNLSNVCDLEHLGDAMLELNIFSVMERYGRDLLDIPGEPFALAVEPCVGRVQPFKSLGCFLYQSCEGRADGEPLYKALRLVEELLGEKVSCQSQAYEDADWG